MRGVFGGGKTGEWAKVTPDESERKRISEVLRGEDGVGLKKPLRKGRVKLAVGGRGTKRSKGGQVEKGGKKEGVSDFPI